MDGRRPDSGPPPEVATVVVVDRVVIKWRQFELPKSSVRKQKKKGMLQGKKKARTDGRKEKKETAGRYDRGLPGCCHLATARPKPRPLRRRKEAPPTEAPPRHLHSSANQRPPFPQWPRTVRTAVVRRIDRNRKQQFHHHHHCWIHSWSNEFVPFSSIVRKKNTQTWFVGRALRNESNQVSVNF